MSISVKKAFKDSFSDGFNPLDVSQMVSQKNLQPQTVEFSDSPSPYINLQASLRTMGDSMRKAMNLDDTRQQSSN